MINFEAMVFDDHFILVQPKLATLVGLNESVILQQLHYWLKDKASIWAEGKPWVYNSIREWQLQFPFWSEDTIRRTLKGMEKAGYILTGNHSTNKFDRRIHYTIDYSNLHTSIYAKCPNGSMQDAQILTETTSENTNIDYQPTSQSVVDTQKQTINGKPMLDSYNSEQWSAVPVYYGADGKVYRCRGGEEPIGTARIADKPSAGSDAVVGGLDSSMIGGEDPFYDGNVVEGEEATIEAEADHYYYYDLGYADGLAGNPKTPTHYEENWQDYLEGYAAGEKRAKARQAAPAREVKDVCVAPPLSTPQLASHYDRADVDAGAQLAQDYTDRLKAGMPNRYWQADVDAGAQTQNRPEAEVTQVTKVIPAQTVVVDTAAELTAWRPETIEYGRVCESLSSEALWAYCLSNLKADDMMYLQKQKLKAKSNPLGYIRPAMIRLLMALEEQRTNPKTANQPTKTDRPTDGPASHRLLVNDDPERERKLAEMEALAGLGPVPEHMKIRRKKKGGE